MERKTIFTGVRKQATERKTYWKRQLKKALWQERLYANAAERLIRSRMGEREYKRTIAIITGRLM